ncbi:enoyl-CoA hydratase-related protein [Nocardia sp. NPDC050193]
MSILVERHDAVTVVTLNRPEVRNALDGATVTAVGQVLAAAEHDDTVRAIVLTGAGERAFCSGMDLKAFATGASLTTETGPGLAIFTQRIYPKPIIAAVNGAAVAGGFELVLACDLVVAAEEATFGLPEVKRGLVAAGGATNLPRRIPLPLALEIALTGNWMTAARAFQIGLVNRVVPRDQVLSEALSLAQTIASNGPLAVRITKELMVPQATGATGVEIGAATAPVFASNDAQEGAVAFLEKRPPRWTGR